MAQINLLGTQEKTTNYSKALSSLVAKAFALVLVLVLVFYAYLVVTGKSKASEIADLEAQISATEQQIQKNEEKNKVYTRQAQLKDLGGLLKNHIYWSGIVPELARTTLRSATYTSFSSKEDGQIAMVVDVPSYQELDKFLQVFDLPEFNQNIGNVKVRSIAKVQQEDALRIQAKIEFTYAIDSLKKSAE